jgi:hypothetical protein
VGIYSADGEVCLGGGLITRRERDGLLYAAEEEEGYM